MVHDTTPFAFRSFFFALSVETDHLDYRLIHDTETEAEREIEREKLLDSACDKATER